MGPNDEEIIIVQKRNSIRTSNNSFLTIVLEKLRLLPRQTSKDGGPNWT